MCPGELSLAATLYTAITFLLYSFLKRLSRSMFLL